MSVGEWGVGGEGRERGPKGKRVALFLTKFPKTGSPMSSIYIYIYIYIVQKAFLHKAFTFPENQYI